MVLFASRLAKQNFCGLHFFSQIRTRLGSASDVVACPHELLWFWTNICRGRSLSVTIQSLSLPVEIPGYKKLRTRFPQNRWSKATGTPFRSAFRSVTDSSGARTESKWTSRDTITSVLDGFLSDLG